MNPVVEHTDLIKHLQKEVIRLQGGAVAQGVVQRRIRCGPIEQAFSGRVFPTGAVHEFISHKPNDAAATNGFMAALIGQLQDEQGMCLWVGIKRSIFPAALQLFGVDPGRIIFISADRPKEVLWAIEEGLKCKALAAVAGELKGLSFTESRRLQLAVEESKVTGFLHRYQPATENTVACSTRWKISSIQSITGGMPGVGYPRWDIHLQKVRNGKPGRWQAEWVNSGFNFIQRPAIVIAQQQLKAG